MVRKIIGVVGLIGAVLAAEGLNRVAAFAGAFKGSDAPFYTACLIVSVFGAGVLLISLFRHIHSFVKWIAVVCLVGALVLLSVAPSFGANQQAFAGLAVALIGLLTVRTRATGIAPQNS